MTIRTILTCAALLLPLAAEAHDGKGVNGGRISDAGSYHLELVLRDVNVEVFLSDENERPVVAIGFKGLAILVVDGKSQRIALQPAGQSLLSGKASAPLPPNAKGAVQLTAPDGTTAQARFN